MTSPTPGIRLSTDQVRRHAQAVDEAGAMLDEALAGAAHVRAANEAYGMLISPLFVPALNAVQDHAIGEIKNAVTATQGLAEQLRTVAAAYDLSDAEGARRLGGK